MLFNNIFFIILLKLMVIINFLFIGYLAIKTKYILFYFKFNKPLQMLMFPVYYLT